MSKAHFYNKNGAGDVHGIDVSENHLDKIRKPEGFWFLDGNNMMKLWLI